MLPMQYSKYISIILLNLIVALAPLKSAAVVAPNDLTNNTSIPIGLRYLAKPSGQYSVGYQDYHWTNDSYPDPFYNGHNQADFSDNNQTHFYRETMVRIYYPSDTTTDDYSPYYPPKIQDMQQQIRQAQVPGITEKNIQSLDLIKTYSHEKAPIITGNTFPVIFFMPGIGGVAQSYTNVILNLVSHGYIVVAINNTFVGGPIEFPDGRIVSANTYDPHNNDLEAAGQDLDYVYNKITTKNELDSPIFSAMDIQELGLLGHSMGGIVTVQFAHQHSNYFQAAVALAAPATEAPYAAFAGFSIPFMHIHDSYWRSFYDRTKHPGIFRLHDNNNFILLSPEQTITDYTGHLNFEDDATLQYQPTIAATYQYQNIAEPYFGSANGFTTTDIIDEYLQQFFDKTLKNKHSNIFDDQQSLKNTIATFGPGLVIPSSD